MPLTLRVGITRKIGLPNYSSLGATCELTMELPHGCWEHDPIAFHEQVHDAYSACSDAVDEALDRHSLPVPAVQNERLPPATTSDCALANGAAAHASSNRSSGAVAPHAPAAANGAMAGNGIDGAGRSRGPDAERPATARQIRAIQSLAYRRGIPLEGLIGGHGKSGTHELSVREASALIEDLQQEDFPRPEHPDRGGRGEPA
jgi:hypothetical protein